MSNEKFNPTKYKNEFQKQKYDRLVINVVKGQKVTIQEFAKSQGKSLNAYIVELIKEDMQNHQSSASV